MSKVARRLTTLAVLFSVIGAGTRAYAEALVDPTIFATVFHEYSGERACGNVRRIVEYHRIQGSPMMGDVAREEVLAALRREGISASIEALPSDGKRKYQTWRSPLGWEIREGELWVEADEAAKRPALRLCRYSDIPMCVSTYSPGGHWSGELVDVGAGTADSDYQGVEVRGKVALGYGYAAQVMRQAVIKRGAVGVVIYPPPGDRPEHPDMVRYNGLWTRADEVDKASGGFQISANQYEQLKAWMKNGAVRVRGHIDAKLQPHVLTIVHAYIRGSETPEREVLLTAHLDHPKWSANDNASGSGALLELARTLHALIATKQLAAPKATLHFMWVPEFFGTIAYVTRHPEARRCGPWDDPRAERPWREGDTCIVANLNLDMVGEDSDQTHSTFLMTRTPDSVPSLLDVVLRDVLEQTKQAAQGGYETGRHWPAEMQPYWQGSDHDVLLGLGVPATMFAHAPDWTHHTSEDTIDKVSARELSRTGSLAGAAAFWLAMHPKRDTQTAARMDREQRRAERAQQRKWQYVLRDGHDSAAAATDESQAETGADPFYAEVGVGPRRLVLLPYDGSVFESLAGEDRAWLEQERQRLGRSRSGEIDFDLVVYEAVNFMNGARNATLIAALLSEEFSARFEAAWVERLIALLARQGLVAPATNR